MKFCPLPLKGAYMIEADCFEDHRGRFARIFCTSEFASIGHTKPLIQANISVTKKTGCVRGMHFQYPPMAECKVVRCVEGRIFDVIVDLRPDSPTFLNWHGEELTPERMNAMYVPEGFAHGFQALEPNTQIVYMITAPYSPADEGGIRPDDPAIGINWPLPVSDISEKDRGHPLINSNFKGIALS